MKWSRRSNPPEAPGWHFASLPGGLRMAHTDADRLAEAVRVLADAGWPGTPPPATPAAALAATATAPSDRENATLGGYTGDACTSCGALLMVRNGACEKCVGCGETSGCS